MHFPKINNLFSRPEERARQAVHSVYMETLELLNAKLLPLGFELLQESHAGLGGLALFKKGGLTARLFMDLRDSICVFSAESGTVRKWFDSQGQELASKYDLYIYLSEPDIRLRFPPELEHWLEDHPE